jgi:hypothetical protein
VAWRPNVLGQEFLIGTLTHFNEPIEGDPFPGPNGDDNGFVGKVGVDYEITIDKFDDDNNLLGSLVLPLIFDVVFFETLNSSDPCPTNPDDGGDCGDTFQFFGDVFQKFEIAGQKYTIQLVGFCEGANFASCAGSDGILYSPEGGTNTAFVFEIKEAPVPGVLALVGAGLIGLGFARRRQANA